MIEPKIQTIILQTSVIPLIVASPSIKKRVEYFTAVMILLSFLVVIVNFIYIFASINFLYGFDLTDNIFLLFMVSNILLVLLVFLYFYDAKRALHNIMLVSLENPEQRYLLSADEVIDETSNREEEVSAITDTIWELLLIQISVQISFCLLVSFAVISDAFQDHPSVQLSVVGYFAVLVTVIPVQSRHLIRVIRTDRENHQQLQKFLIVLLIIQPLTIMLIFYAEPIAIVTIGSYFLKHYEFHLAVDVVYSLFVLLLIPLYLTVYGVVHNADIHMDV